MFNFYGKHKIGIIGSSNSGKTIFLTSLLWNLFSHDPERFVVGNGAEVTDFRIVKNLSHDFGFDLHKNTFIQQHRWPDKTTDFSLASCRFNRSDRMCERKVTFLDIPGERMSDILLWKAHDYTEWVSSLQEFWDENPLLKACVAPYQQKASQVDASVEELAVAYKRAAWSLLEKYCPITPSTYYLGTDGQMLGDEQNADKERAISSRPICSFGELLPLPGAWLAAHPEEKRRQEELFAMYKRDVLKPLFKEIDGCDNFVFCVDVLNILMSGSGLLLQTQREFKDFINHLAPSKWLRLVNKVGNNPPRLAFIATKSDLVPSSDKDRMLYLLKDFAKPLKYSGIKYRHFICSSCVSSEYVQDEAGNTILKGKDRDNPTRAIELKSQLPEYWPDVWDGSAYGFPEIAPVVSAARPPRQVNLDRIFEFVLEDQDSWEG